MLEYGKPGWHVTELVEALQRTQAIGLKIRRPLREFLLKEAPRFHALEGGRMQYPLTARNVTIRPVWFGPLSAHGHGAVGIHISDGLGHVRFFLNTSTKRRWPNLNIFNKIKDLETFPDTFVEIGSAKFTPENPINYNLSPESPEVWNSEVLGVDSAGVEVSMGTNGELILYESADVPVGTVVVTQVTQFEQALLEAVSWLGEKYENRVSAI